ncbi:tissue factor pathway inhibitor [Poecilia latipinna]|uniref:tissue factor pathway inhibitor n=1 Tax=Poecilia latipinna TaxID=48699 RepID=UPI00072DDD8B|nr:PREDICTED: tissue factor pathway inhibitor-like [Poecilia latipinna]
MLTWFPASTNVCINLSSGFCRCLFPVDLTCSDLFSLSDPNKRLQPKITVFSKDACLQRQDPGGCQDYAMMWFFDTVQDECARFWYGGCDGNANRFETQEECENLCLTHIQ